MDDVKLRLDSIERNIRELTDSVNTLTDLVRDWRENGAERTEGLNRAVEAFEAYMADHENRRRMGAELADALGRISKIEAYCPECPRRPTPTPPPNGEGT